MVTKQYLLFAVLALLIFLAILAAFVIGPDIGPWSDGASPSLVDTDK